MFQTFECSEANWMDGLLEFLSKLYTTVDNTMQLHHDSEKCCSCYRIMGNLQFALPNSK